MDGQPHRIVREADPNCGAAAIAVPGNARLLLVASRSHHQRQRHHQHRQLLTCQRPHCAAPVVHQQRTPFTHTSPWRETEKEKKNASRRRPRRRTPFPHHQRPPSLSSCRLSDHLHINSSSTNAPPTSPRSPTAPASSASTAPSPPSPQHGTCASPPPPPPPHG